MPEYGYSNPPTILKEQIARNEFGINCLDENGDVPAIAYAYFVVKRNEVEKETGCVNE